MWLSNLTAWLLCENFKNLWRLSEKKKMGFSENHPKLALSEIYPLKKKSYSGMS